MIAEHGSRAKTAKDDPRRLARRGPVWALRRVRYDCASPSVDYWINRLARKIGLTDTEFKASEQTTAEHIAAMPCAVPDDEPATNPAEPSNESEPIPDQQAQTAPTQAPAPREPEHIPPPIPQPLEPETVETEAERRWRYRDVLGIDEPQPRRRWRLTPDCSTFRMTPRSPPNG